MSVRNMGLPLFPVGSEVFFPPHFEWEQCRQWLRNRGVRLDSGRWDEVRLEERLKNRTMDFVFGVRAKSWTVK